MTATIELWKIGLCILLSFILTFLSIPIVIKKMRKADFCGIDVNKLEKPKIPEMGGIGGILGFTLGTTITLGLVKYVDSIDESPVLVAICVLSIASLIGIMDDISILNRKEKAWFITFASLPLIISQKGESIIDILIYQFEFSGSYYYLFWLIIVPIGISGIANALNMSGGYNGVESGQMVVISLTLIVISLIRDVDLSITIVFAGVFGASFALYWFNKYPAKIFIGDVGQLGFGAVLGSAVIMSGLMIFGVICILPAFYELFATLKYKFLNIERKEVCRDPIIMPDGTLKPPDFASDYTLFYLILSKKPLSEKGLSNIIISIYCFFGIISIILSLFT